MSANVSLSETFDQWRVKTNELLVMTQADGSSNLQARLTPLVILQDLSYLQVVLVYLKVW
jgi:hypothetical protein